MFICISSDATFSCKYAVPFGGFESCETGNPFVLKSVSNMIPLKIILIASCPFAYTKYPNFDDGCWINVAICLLLNSTSGIQALLPLFHKYPNSISTNEVLATSFTGANGEKWIIDSSGRWGISAHGGNGSNGTMANEISLPQNTSDPSNLMIAVASALGTLIRGAMIVLLVFIGLYAIKGNKQSAAIQQLYTIEQPN